jgi:LPXTG-motif cell wall-anchored protein
VEEIFQWARNCLQGVVEASTLVRDAVRASGLPKAPDIAASIEQAYEKLSKERYAALTQGSIKPSDFQQDCLNFLLALDGVVQKAGLQMGEKFQELMAGVRQQIGTIPEVKAETPPTPATDDSKKSMLFILGLVGMAGLGYWAYRKMKTDKPKPTLAERLEAEGDEGDAFDGLEDYEEVEGDKPEELVDPHEEGGITIVKG